MQLLIQYQEKVLTPHLWINQADELIKSSKIFEPSIKKYWKMIANYYDPKSHIFSPPSGFKPPKLLQSTYFLLVAYAIENYFKAILVNDHKCKYQNEIIKTG